MMQFLMKHYIDKFIGDVVGEIQIMADNITNNIFHL